MRDPQELLCVRVLNMLTKGMDQDPNSSNLFIPIPDHLIAKFSNANQVWMRSPSIVGFGVGMKRVGRPREDTRHYVLKVYVSRKLDLPHDTEQCVPPVISTPVGEVQTDVLESGEILPISNLKNRLRPAKPGLRIGLDKTPEGTFGCLVKRQDDDDSLYILSNNHVIGGWGMKDGSGNHIYANHPVYQPMSSRVVADDQIASLSFLIDYKFGKNGKYENLVDAAIAKVDDPTTVSKLIIGSGAPSGLITTPTIGVTVRKTGFSTGVTSGQVTDIDFCTWAEFPINKHASMGTVEFSQQIVVTPDSGFNDFSASGDSGSVVLDDNNKLIGLLWGGTNCENPSPGIPIVEDPCGVCNNINNVFSALSLKLP